MKKVLRIDNEGFYLEDVILQDDELTPNDCIETQCQDGFYKPKWNGAEWVEGLTQDEITTIKNQPQPKTEVELLREEIERMKSVESQQNSDLENFMDIYFTA